MFGEQLGVNMHVMTAAASSMRNLSLCIHRCHLEIESIAIAPYAAGMSCLVADEKLGAICIDMGVAPPPYLFFLTVRFCLLIAFLSGCP